MSDGPNIEKFLKERARVAEELKLVDKLVRAYKNSTPKVTPIWDATPNSITFNDISNEILQSGMDIYTASFDDVWAGIFEPEIYDKDTLWKTIHDSRKIARVIEAWENKQALSPLFFVKHGSKDLALVADGKHRLTVARCMGCENIPFMVQSNTSSWLKNAIPSAEKI
ncbi:ParB N-terminal domain-containing protein [Neptunomonas phycophila]|uniref:ParB N-terminal domain-containing protein n=1 Tax=Neptunomonas phycophila TaxID=1572645 RepID=UPI00094892C1|nr:ParB N-terminal domain-containing protein [Neptunomonas phycophila]